MTDGQATQIVQQRSIVQPYTSEINQPCLNGDWAYGERRDCGQNCIRLECSELDPNTCPSIGTNIQSAWARDPSGNSLSPFVSCTYDPSTFDLDDVLEYQNQFGEDPTYNEVVMPEFCLSGTSTSCPENPHTGLPWKHCPNILDTGQTGEVCRDWRSKNIKTADDSQYRYCQSNSSDPTCACYQRSSDPVYSLISGDISFNDGCWYRPCSDPESYLVASNLINDDPPCPDENVICPEVNRVIGESVSNIPVSQFEKSITCPVTTTPQPEPNGTITTYRFIIIIILLVIIIFIFFLFIIIFIPR